MDPDDDDSPREASKESKPSQGPPSGLQTPVNSSNNSFPMNQPNRNSGTQNLFPKQSQANNLPIPQASYQPFFAKNQLPSSNNSIPPPNHSQFNSVFGEKDKKDSKPENSVNPLMPLGSSVKVPPPNNVPQRSGFSQQPKPFANENLGNTKDEVQKVIIEKQNEIPHRTQALPSQVKSPEIPKNPAISISETAEPKKVELKAVSQAVNNKEPLNQKPAFSSDFSTSSKVMGIYKNNPEDSIEKQKNYLEMLTLLQDYLVASSYLKSPSSQKKLDQTQKIFEDFFCLRCQKFYVKFELECGHHTCLGCFCEGVKSLIKERTLESLNDIRCEHCSLFFTAKDVSLVYGENSPDYAKFSTLIINKRCIWCKRELNVMKSFFSELNCLHLCSECYTSEVFYGGKKCFGCGDPFHNIDFTLNRKAVCLRCKQPGLLVKTGFRALHDDHRFCFTCCKDDFHNKVTSCTDCNKNFSKEDKSAFNFFYVKYCIFCKKTVSVVDLFVCQTCQFISCETCNEAFPHLCIN
jgi:hypothetical protein